MALNAQRYRQRQCSGRTFSVPTRSCCYAILDAFALPSQDHSLDVLDIGCRSGYLQVARYL